MSIVIKNLQEKAIIDSQHIRTLAQQLSNRLNLSEKSQITIVFVDNKKMQELNYKYLNHNYPTDVLAFSLSRHKINQKTAITGDVIINTELACENAPLYKNSVIKEITLYIIHGILHLAGYTDYKQPDKQKMERLQERLLNELISKNDSKT